MISSLIEREGAQRVIRVNCADFHGRGPFWGHATVWGRFNLEEPYISVQLDSQETRSGAVELRMTPDQAKAFAIAILQRVAEQESPS